jgi:hypothetical protein
MSSMANTAGSSVGGGADIITSILGANASQPDRDKAQAALNNALAQIQAVGAPPDMSQQILVQQFQQAGILTPERESNINQQFVQLQQNPAQAQGLAAQVQALGQIQKEAGSGMSAQDQANYLAAQTAINQNTQSQQQAALQNQAQRGSASGGAGLAAELQAVQGGANQNQMAGLQEAGAASQRALSAMGQAGQLGGQIESQQYGQAAQQQQAQQAIQAANTQNALAVQQQNTQAQNQANLYNQQVAQQVANANTQAANAESLRELQGKAQTYQMGLGQAGMEAGTEGAISGGYLGQANAIGQEYQNIGQGIGMFAGSGQSEGYSNQTQGNSMSGSSGGSQSSGGNSGGMSTEGGNYGNSANNYGGDMSAFGGASYWTGGPVQQNNDMGDLSTVASLGELFLKDGGKVPGRAQVAGNSPQNDTVNAKLSPGEIVIPRTIAHDPEAAKDFIKKEIDKDTHARLTALEKFCMGGMKGQ